MTGPVRGNAWLLDGDGELWVLHGPDPAGTGMAVYQVPGEAVLYRALAIEDEHGIDLRGPAVVLDDQPAAGSTR